jgi:hypothetical protein
MPAYFARLFSQLPFFHRPKRNGKKEFGKTELPAASSVRIFRLVTGGKRLSSTTFSIIASPVHSFCVNLKTEAHEKNNLR